MEFLFNKAMENLIKKNAIKEIEKKNKEMEELKKVVNDMEKNKELVKKVDYELSEEISSIGKLLLALEDGTEFSKKALAKILKKIVKENKPNKKTFKKFMEKEYLDEDLKNWKKNQLLSLVSKLAKNDIKSATGISLGLMEMDKKKGKKKDKDPLGYFKAPKTKKTKEMTDEQKIQKEIRETYNKTQNIFRDALKEVDSTIRTVGDEIEKLTKQRIAGRNMALVGFYGVKKDLLKTKLDVGKEMMSINKNVLDSSFKRIKESKDKKGALTEAEMFTNFFGASLNGTIEKSSKSKSKNKKRKERDKEFERKFNSRKIELNEYDSMIKYEGNWTPAIKANYEETEWKFIAIDHQNNIIKKFPKSQLPNPKMASIEFNDDGETARDKKSGAIYKVIKVRGPL